MKWAPRDTAQQLQRLTRHTSLVLVSKYSLVVLAVVLVAMVFLVPVLHDDDSGARLVFTNVEVGEAMKPRMNRPRLQGIDKQGRPYTVSSNVAERQEDGRVWLDYIEADLTLTNGSWLSVIATNGLLDSEANTLHLPESVQMFHDTGYDMRTRDVMINLNESTAKGDERVNAQGPLGTLQADGFRINNETGIMRFEPAVKVKLWPKRGD